MRFRDLFGGARSSMYTNSGNAYTAEMLQILRERCGLDTSQRVAVVGTTTGRLSSLLLSLGYAITAVEADTDRLRELSEMQRRWPSLSVVDGQAHATELRPRSFDFVVSERALYQDDPAAVRLEFARILRPDGLAVLITDNRVYGGSSQSEAFGDLLRTHCVRFREKLEPFAIREAVNNFFPEGDFYEDAVIGQQSLSRSAFIAQTSALPIFPRPSEPGYMEAQVALRTYFAYWSKDGLLSVPFVHRFAAGRVKVSTDAGSRPFHLVGTER